LSRTFWAAPPFRVNGSSSVPSSRCNAVDKSARWGRAANRIG
jgi:hypothetical protein